MLLETNFIKLLTHKSWGLKKSTLVQIYKSLIRSIIEYTGLSYYGFCPEQRRELEVIQNSALRVIFNKKREDGTKNFLKLAGIESIKARMCKLNKAYLRKSIRTENPLIVDHIENYKNIFIKDKSRGYFSGATILNQDKYFNSIINQPR